MLKQIARLTTISLVILFIVVFAVSALFPSTVVVSRAVNINVSQEKIFPQINNFTAWKTWMEGVNDTTLKIQSANEAFIGDNKVSLAVDADSNKVHSVWTNPHNRIMNSDINLFANTSAPNVTVVQWQFVQKLKWYPWEKFGSLLSDKILGSMMEKNLNKLKEEAER